MLFQRIIVFQRIIDYNIVFQRIIVLQTICLAKDSFPLRETCQFVPGINRENTWKRPKNICLFFFFCSIEFQNVSLKYNVLQVFSKFHKHFAEISVSFCFLKCNFTVSHVRPLYTNALYSFAQSRRLKYQLAFVLPNGFAHCWSSMNHTEILSCFCFVHGNFTLMVKTLRKRWLPSETVQLYWRKASKKIRS